jgi:branched-chain amino acid transport system substrate-binding protein
VKRLSIIILSVVMLVVLAACGGQQSGSTNTTEKKGDSMAGAKTKDSGDTLTIGAILPLTGPGAVTGESMKNGIDFAVEDINNAGGIKGKKLVIDYQDGKGDPKTSVLAAQNLTAKGYSFALTTYSSATLAILPVAERGKMTLVNGGAQSDELAGASPYLFNTIPLLSHEVDVLAKYAARDGGMKTAFIIHNDEDSGKAGLDRFTEQFEKNGGKIVGNASHKVGETNFRSIILKAKNSKADAIYIASYDQDAKIIIDQIRELGLKQQILVTSWVIFEELLKSQNGQGIIYSQLALNPKKEWMDRFGKKYNTKLAQLFNVTYYDSVMVFKRAYEYAVDKGYGKDGDALRKAIAEIKKFDSVSGSIEFREDGTSVRPVNIAIIKDQKSQIIKEY